MDGGEGETGLFVPRSRRNCDVLMGSTVAMIKEGKIVVSAVNTTEHRARLPARHVLGDWMPLKTDAEVLSFAGALSRDRVVEWLSRVKNVRAEPLDDEEKLHLSELSAADSELLLQLLRRFRTRLREYDGCPPPNVTDVRHHIHTGDAAPIYQRRLRGLVSEQETIRQHVDEMLAHGVIEMVHGAWAFPVVLVRKKDGSLRFCVDYRGLNAVTTRNVYPLPRIDETLETRGGAVWFTTLDLHADYWQVEVAEEDRNKTAFITRQGLCRFLCMPFGLVNAPSTFQRVMNCVLRGLLWDSCLVYLDDIIVFTKGAFKQHVVDPAVVFDQLEHAGLTLKTSKCTFGAKEIDYLGHRLTSKGILPQERLVTAVREFTEPTDTKGVKRFVHLTGYYRRFIPHFGTRATPVTRLLRKDVKWEWGDEQREAFEDRRRVLTKKPLLVYPDFERPFLLATDASAVGCGACLMQEHGDGLQPVAYASKVNNPQQQQYCITEL